MTMRASALAILMAIVLSSSSWADENWPQWRGPNQNGVSNSVGLPETWSETENILWKTPLPSWSASSPIIWGETVFVMSPSKPDTALDDARRQLQAGGSDILMIAISKADGHVLWERVVDSGNVKMSKHNSCSPSPVTDGVHVCSLTGNGLVATMTMTGEILWENNLRAKYGPLALIYGYASSPVICDGKVIIQVLRGPRSTDVSYLVAFNIETGKEEWRVERPTNGISGDVYTTPTLLTLDGKTQCVVSGGDVVTAHDPATGREIWRAAGLNPSNASMNRMVSSPVVAGDMVFASAFMGPLIAVRVSGGSAASGQLAWTWDKGSIPDVPTPACDGSMLYVVDDRGEATCIKALTGELMWAGKATGGVPVSASPLVADGKVYITDEKGTTTVLAIGPQLRIIAANKLDCDGQMLASMAVSGNRFFLRSPTHLYCIGKKESTPAQN